MLTKRVLRMRIEDLVAEVEVVTEAADAAEIAAAVEEGDGSVKIIASCLKRMFLRQLLLFFSLYSLLLHQL